MSESGEARHGRFAAALVAPSPAVLALVAAMLAAPFLIFATAPLHDWPNHLGELHVLYDDPPPAAASYYAPHWRFLPNLALEGWVGIFHHVMPIDDAARLFLAATAAQLFLGAVSLHRALFGRTGGVILAAAFFVYGAALLMGLANDCFGIGMALWVLALWLGRRARPAWMPVFALLATLILLAHLFAFAVYALVATGIAAGEFWRGRRRGVPAATGVAVAIRALAHLALPAALLGFGAHGAFWAPSHYEGLAAKLFAIRCCTTGFYTPDLDLAVLVLVGGGIALLMLTRRLVVAPEMAAPLVLLAAAFLILPDGKTFFDYRMPAVMMLLLTASLDWRGESRSLRDWTSVALLALFALRMAVLLIQWAEWQRTYDDYRAAFAVLPRGAHLLTLGSDPGTLDQDADPPLAFVDALAVGERGAYVPSLFAGFSHQLLVALPGPPPAFDYVLLVHPERLERAQVPAYEPMASGDTFILGRLRR